MRDQICLTIALVLTVVPSATAQEIATLRGEGSVLLDLRSADPTAPGGGPSRWVDVYPEISGRVFLWTRPTPLDLVLRVEDGKGKVLKEDDDSGGGTTPCVQLDVEPDAMLRVFVVAKQPDAAVQIEFCLRCAVETDETREAALVAERELREIRELHARKEWHAARDRVAGAIVELASSIESDAESSWQVAQMLWQCGGEAAQLSLVESTTQARRIVLATRTRVLPDDHPDLQAARAAAANAAFDAGDFAGARALAEKVLEVRSRTLPETSLNLQIARRDLARIMMKLGDLATARALGEQALAVGSRTLRDDHPDLQWMRGNLAEVMRRQGDYRSARPLAEKALEVRLRTLPDEHRDLQKARANLALILEGLGDFERATALLQKVLEVNERTLPEDHIELQRARQNLVVHAARVADQKTCRRMTRDLAQSTIRIIRSALTALSPREVAARAAGEEHRFNVLASVASGYGRLAPDPEIDRDVATVLEMLRVPDLISARILSQVARNPRLREFSENIGATSTALTRLAQTAGNRDRIQALVTQRDDFQRALATSLSAQPETQLLLAVPTVEVLCAKLAPDQALISYRCYDRYAYDDDLSERPTTVSLLAYVYRAGAKLERVELGTLATIDQAVRDWRTSLGAPVERGARAASQPDTALRERGQRLRELVFDPLRPVLGDARRVVVVMDDVLHTMPLETLPDKGDSSTSEASLLGEHYTIETRLCLREILFDAGETTPAVNTLLAAGGAAFNSPPLALASEETAQLEVPESPAGPVSPLLRGGPWERGFDPLTYTGLEARGIAALFEEAFDGEHHALLLEKRKASRSAIEKLAPRARYLHIATHGWFAPESVRAWNDPDPVDASAHLAPRMTAVEQVGGLSPMVLCGLALAGANLAEESGQLPGLVTAEEIATWDLANCELAVLSACDTNVGLRRAGQGVASLQRALHMAGARSVITSLWKVPDVATKELMLDFYRRLWIEKKPKAQALWEAKMKLRGLKDERGEPRYATRDWAAWVLSGDPR